MHCYHNVLGWYSSFLPVCNSMKSACLEVTYSWLCMYQYLQVSYDNKPEWLQPSQLPLPSELTGWSTVGQVQCLCMYMPVCTGLYVVVLVYVHASMYWPISVLVYVHASIYISDVNRTVECHTFRCAWWLWSSYNVMILHLGHTAALRICL